MEQGLFSSNRSTHRGRYNSYYTNYLLSRAIAGLGYEAGRRGLRFGIKKFYDTVYPQSQTPSQYQRRFIRTVVKRPRFNISVSPSYKKTYSSSRYSKKRKFRPRKRYQRSTVQNSSYRRKNYRSKRRNFKKLKYRI